MRENGRINEEWVVILNVLSLLREQAMTHEELWKSGYFKTLGQLGFALQRLEGAGCIEKIQSANTYVILGRGTTLLSFYPSWKCLHFEVFEVLDVVVPIGDSKRE
jgi:hypothetical protein